MKTKSRLPLARQHWIKRWAYGVPVLLLFLLPFGTLEAIIRAILSAARSGWITLRDAEVWDLSAITVLAIVFGDFESDEDRNREIIRRMTSRAKS